MPAFRTSVLVLLAVAAAGLSVACTPSQARVPAAGEKVQVTERDFQITAPKSVSSGDLVLHVKNEGPEWHELIVVHRGKRLPLRTDGMTVNEEALAGAIAGILEPAAAGVRDLRLHLAPGHYQFFCNMAGHFMAGMSGDIVVR
ncbi:MAG: hypothetical protein QOG21_2506 [Actinomycetota bacterium]|nr:hypothetical protein [Actinomycetota bacterium]